MQVRKFEAKTIKDAIELVKHHMGPDAIILSAKENVRGFGLMGESSVEVTAAVSETKLQKKHTAERKLDPRNRAKYDQSTAKKQKEFIDKSSADDAAEKFMEMDGTPDRVPAKPKRRVATTRPYVDISEDENEDNTAAPEAVRSSRSAGFGAGRAQTYARTSSSIQVPTAAMLEESMAAQNRPAARLQMPNNPPERLRPESDQIGSLKNEISQLRGLLTNFHNVPQNFVTMHPGANEGIPYEFSFAFKKLQEAGVSLENIVKILRTANEVLPGEQKKKRPLVDGWLIKYFLDHVHITPKPFHSKLQIFVGPTGQGKTSSIIKCACHLMLKEKKKVALLTGDHLKVGATDQFKIYAQILNAPYAAINGANDWVELAKSLSGMDYVLLDTPGLNLKGAQDLDSLRKVLPPQMQGAQIHYVQSIMARDVDAVEVAERFKIIGFDDVIFTRLDEAVQYGIIYNFSEHFGVPIHSFGTGYAIPEDFEFATKERFVDLIFNLSNFRKEKGTP